MTVQRRWLCQIAACCVIAPFLCSRTIYADVDQADLTGQSQELLMERTACLQWVAEAQSGCSTAEEVAASVESVLDRPVFVADNCDIHVRGSLAQSTDGGWRATLTFTTKDGQSLGMRHLEGSEADCASLRGPASLAIALMVEATDTLTPIPETVTPKTEMNTPLPCISVPITSVTRSGVSIDPSPVQRRAYADLRGSYGLLPGASLGVSVGLNATLYGTLPSRIETTLWLPKPTDARPGGRFWAWHAGVALCPSWNFSASVQVALCAGAQVGVIRAIGLGLDGTEAIQRPYGHAEARVVLSIPFGRALALAAHVAFAVPLLRAQFVYYDPTGSEHDVHRPNPAIPMLGLGVIWSDAKPAPPELR